MTVYLCPLIGDGKTIATAFRPDLAGKTWESAGEVGGGYMAVSAIDTLAFPTIIDPKSTAQTDAAKAQLVKDGKNPSPEASDKPVAVVEDQPTKPEAKPAPKK